MQRLGGYAGTGKTTILSFLAAALPDWAPVAFTGKAAFVMREKGMAATPFPAASTTRCRGRAASRSA